ncbi:MAG: MBL fold metallo-hydrolase [Oscillospiraceae bacterium]|nr:MBL fold metallo-hydrolase [Oscillospiraceae bacterium]
MDEKKFSTYLTEDGFWCIEQMGVRSFLFVGDSEALLVDCCFGGDLRSVCEGITDKPLRVVITHADGDHTGCARQFEKIYMHPAEFDRYYLKNNHDAPAAPLWEGDVIDIGTFRFEVILIPGHTPGSIALLEREKRFVIGGDSIASGPIFMFGDGRNVPAFLASMEKLKNLRADFDKVYGSHHRLIEDPAVIDDLASFASDVLEGDLPEPQDDPGGKAPPHVRLYCRGNAGFLLAKP